MGWLIAQFAAKNSHKATIKAESAPLPEQQDEASRAELSRTPFIDVSELGLPSFDAELPISDPEPALSESATVEAREIDPAEPEETLELVPGKGAATVLKSRPISQMSLVQMIERFALALDEHRAAVRHEGESTIARFPSPALIEAMRTLPVVNPKSLHRFASHEFASHGNAALATDPAQQADDTERALREALEKLQRMSGGA